MKMFRIAVLLTFTTLSIQASSCMPRYMHDNCSVDGYGIIEIEKKPHIYRSTYRSSKTKKKSKRTKYYVKKCRKVVRYR